MLRKINPDDLLPGIFQYLEGIDTAPIDIQELVPYVQMVQVKTGLTHIVSETIVKMFFHEIRNAMLRGDVVDLHHLGRLLVANPHNSKNIEYIFPKFHNSKSFLKRLNGR